MKYIFYDAAMLAQNFPVRNAEKMRILISAAQANVPASGIMSGLVQKAMG